MSEPRTFSFDCSFVERLNSIVSANGDKLAVCVDGEEKYTYGDLWERAEVFANSLVLEGVQPGTVVGLSLPKSYEFIVAVVAIWMCRAVWVPIDPELPLARREFMQEDAGVWFLVDRNWIDRIAQTGNHRCFLVGGAILQSTDLAYIIYTSGTSGKPKGVEVTHAGLVPMLDQQIAKLRLDSDSRSLWLLSISFDASISDIGTALLAGGSIWIDHRLTLQGKLAASSAEFANVVRRNAITYVDIPPAYLATLDPRDFPDCLKTILVGGEVCIPDVVRKWANQVHLINVYGPTEATVCTSMSVCTDRWDRPLIGQPLDGVTYRIDGEKNPQDVVAGELLVGGGQLARGYRNLTDLTSQKFFYEAGTKWYRTGDSVKRDVDGEYVFLGRIDRQIKLRGHRIEPGEIELALIAHPEVRRAAVVAIANSEKKGLVAFVEANCAKSPEKNLEAELRFDLAASLPAYCIPSRFEFVQQLPTTATGKIDLNALPKLLNQIESSPYNDDGNEVVSEKKQLRELFTESLGHNRFTNDERFYEIGGDSLSALGLSLKAQAKSMMVSPVMLVELGSVNGIFDALKLTFGKPSLGVPAHKLLDDVEVAESGGKFCAAPNRLCLTGITPRGQDGKILLTGATGFLGSRILVKLLEQNRQVVCLVRAEDNQQARTRLKEALAKNKLDSLNCIGSRLSILAGDIGRYEFGLPRQVYRELAGAINHVVHSAAEVNLAKTYEQLRTTNLVGTQNVVDFALEANVEVLDYISTLSVFVGTDRFRGTMSESDDLSTTQTVYGGYAQSKWAAEMLLRRNPAIKNVLRIFRLGLLTTDLETGVFAQDDLLPMTVAALCELGQYPELPDELRLDSTPVNFAAHVIAGLIELNPEERCFHVAHDTGIYVKQIVETLESLKGKFEQVTVNRFRQTLQGSNLDNNQAMACLALARSASANRLDYPDPMNLFQATDAEFDLSNTERQLRKLKIRIPKMDPITIRKTLQPMANGIEVGP